MSRPEPDPPNVVKLVHQVEQPPSDDIKAELVSILLRDGVPGKDEILHVKKLVREIADQDASPVCAKTFISSYFDLYLGRVTGDAAIEKAALRRCLNCLGVQEFRQAVGT